MEPAYFPYDFIIRDFEYNGVQYKVALTPELYPEEGLEFTGSYHGILISASRGTKVFELMPDAHSKWETDPKSMDPGLIDILDGIITEIRTGWSIHQNISFNEILLLHFYQKQKVIIFIQRIA